MDADVETQPTRVVFTDTLEAGSVALLPVGEKCADEWVTILASRATDSTHVLIFMRDDGEQDSYMQAGWVPVRIQVRA